MIRLLPGDCRSVLRDLPDASVHCCVTDPPYGLEFMGKEWDAPWNGSAWQSGAGFSKPGIGERKTAWPTFTGGNDEFGGANPTCAKCGGRARGRKKCDCEAPDWRVKGAAPDRMYGRQRQMQTYQAWCEEWAREVLRVLKPGGHLVAFGGTRTSHRMACAIEDAGFEIRDTLCWLYGSGFPKSHDVSKAIDRAAGVERRPSGEGVRQTLNAMGDGLKNRCAVCGRPFFSANPCACPKLDAATPDAQRWQGWGTALKPAHEPIILARKPLAGTVAANVIAHGTGAINVDACRVGTQSTRRSNTAEMGYHGGNLPDEYETGSDAGRWPANMLHDGSDEVEAAFAAFGDAPGQQRYVGPEHGYRDSVNCYGDYGARPATPPRGDTGSASRFFYSAKATAADRADSRHPTVKPVELMRWLVRLVTPPGGTVLDPFAGSGTTGEAAMLEGFDAVLIEQDTQHVADIRHRMDRWSGEDAPLFAEPSPPSAEDPEEARQMALFMEPEYGA